jgi:hypothetical protein
MITIKHSDINVKISPPLEDGYESQQQKKLFIFSDLNDLPKISVNIVPEQGWPTTTKRCE